MARLWGGEFLHSDVVCHQWNDTVLSCNCCAVLAAGQGVSHLFGGTVFACPVRWLSQIPESPPPPHQHYRDIV